MLEIVVEYSKKVVEARKRNNHFYKRDSEKIKQDEIISRQVGQIMAIKNTINKIKKHGKSNQQS